MLKIAILKIIKFYMTKISPCFPARCRFYPTCSQYCFEAVKLFGCFKGLGLGLMRFLKCNPYSKGGFDPVIKNSKNIHK